MEKYTTGLLANMHYQLQKVAIEAENNLQLAEQSFHIAESSIDQLKEYISTFEFKSKEQEINFFKEIKPLFSKEEVYFSELFSIEAEKPKGSLKKQKAYYKQCLIAIGHYFDKNKQFYNYYLTNKSHSDETFFLRKSLGNAEQLVITHDLDQNFATPYSNTLSTLQAYERLREFLQHTISTESSSVFVAAEKKKRHIVWTDSKSALIELLFAIHARGSVNFGNISVKQLVADVEDFFNISLGNVHASLCVMGIRKKGRTPFLDNLKQALENKLDARDD